MDEKTLETQQIADEKLDGVAGGVLDNARLETRSREAAATDDEGEDQSLIPFLKCPMCGRSFRMCTCRR